MSEWVFDKIDAPTMYVDVDDTLLEWPNGYGEGEPLINFDTTKKIRDFFHSGGTVYIWSRGGALHAQRAAKFCAVQHYCDGFLNKPTQLIDDNREWFEEVSWDLI